MASALPSPSQDPAQAASPAPEPGSAPVLARARARAAAVLRTSAWPWACLALLAALAVVRPFGNYALNDDWTYAHIAKTFAETGRMRLDSPVVASTVGQVLLAAPVIVLFGFSHTALRMLTIALSCVALWALDRLLAHAGCRRATRLIALVLLALNPMFFSAAASFMTEIYGWGAALLGALVWVEGRRRDPSRVSYRWSIATGLALGATFWIRQPCVISYPAAVGATLLHLGLQRRWGALRRSALPVLAGLACFVALVLSFFAWAKSTDNFTPVFSTRLPNILRFDPDTYVMEGGAVLFYATAYFLPLLALAVRPRNLGWKAALAGAVFVAFAAWSRATFQTHAPTDDALGMNWIHRSFPFVMNLIYNAGLGPVTVSDVFWHGAPGPRWPHQVWSAIELVLLFGTVLWGAASLAGARALRATRGGVAFEVVLFGMLFAAGAAVALVQESQMEVVDRYHFPVILACALWLPAALDHSAGERPPLGRPGAVAFAALLAPLAAFSVLGLHDLFRWNDARWTLVERAFSMGGVPGTVEGGFEVSCWHREEKMWPKAPVDGTPFRCAYFAACCLDDRFRVGMAVLPGYQPVAWIQPEYWLAPGPPLFLSRRPVF